MPDTIEAVAEAAAVAQGALIGQVGALWRYPVQSLRGERLDALAVTAAGAVGDRAYGILDPELGQVVSSAQGKKKWRHLVAASARFLAPPAADAAMPPVEIRLPDGRRIASDAADRDDRLSAGLGAPAKLVRKGEAPCSYGHAPLHLLTTASQRGFGAHYPAGQFAAARFRSNVLIDCGEESGFIENGWIGREIAIGERVRLRVSEHCKRCVMTVLPQGDLPQDPAILQTVTERNATRAGIYAEVLRPGPLRLGDPVRLLD